MQLASQLVMLTEVQTSMPIMWQIGPQLDSILATFPFQDPLLSVLEMNHLPLF